MATSDGNWTHETKPNGMVVSFVTGRDPPDYQETVANLVGL